MKKEKKKIVEKGLHIYYNGEEIERGLLWKRFY